RVSSRSSILPKGGNVEDGVFRQSRGRKSQSIAKSKVRSRPPGIWSRHVLVCKAEPDGLEQIQILFRGLLHRHWMPEEDPHRQGSDEGRARFGQEERTAWSEHSIELAGDVFLIVQVVQGLVTEDGVQRCVRNIEARRI